jgi:hypothetical protein
MLVVKTSSQRRVVCLLHVSSNPTLTLPPGWSLLPWTGRCVICPGRVYALTLRCTVRPSPPASLRPTSSRRPSQARCLPNLTSAHLTTTSTPDLRRQQRATDVCRGARRRGQGSPASTRRCPMTTRDPPVPHCRTPRIMVFPSYRSALFTPFATMLGCSATSCSRPMQAPSRCCCALVAGYARSLTRAIAFAVGRPVIDHLSGRAGNSNGCRCSREYSHRCGVHARTVLSSPGNLPRGLGCHCDFELVTPEQESLRESVE